MARSGRYRASRRGSTWSWRFSLRLKESSDKQQRIWPPVTAPGTISLTIRIPSQAVHRVHDPDFNELMRRAAIPASAGRPDRQRDADAELLALCQAQDWPAFFALAVKAKKTIAATGSTGSSKTSLLRRLMQEIPHDERLVTIEDTEEFGPLPLRNRVSLFYGAANVSAEHAVEASLRMRPDRLAMQELRGAEAFSHLRLLAAGHPGGLTTCHAEEGDPFTPLAPMAKTGARYYRGWAVSLPPRGGADRNEQAGGDDFDPAVAPSRGRG
ncbi:MAG: ATPase, T2SS/T4P/T4SS family [Stellaceae bacterium]